MEQTLALLAMGSVRLINLDFLLKKTTIHFIIKRDIFMKFEMFLTDKAKNFLKGKLSNDKSLSIKIKKTGCSGYAYDLNYVQSSQDDLEINGVRVLISEQDRPYINMSVVDLKKDGLNSRIVFENPQAINECGCGESFGLRK